MKADLQFGDRLKSLMQAKGLNASAVGKALNISHVAVGDWIKNGAIPKSDKLERLAKLLGVSIDELLKGKAYIDLKADPSIVNEKAKHIEKSADPGNAAFNELGMMQMTIKDLRKKGQRVADELRALARSAPALLKLADELDPPLHLRHRSRKGSYGRGGEE